MKFFEKIAFNMPFRMALGKLGIRLVAIGRQLQIRYANWNREFRITFQEQPVRTHGLNCGDFFVSEELTSTQGLTFHSRDSQPDKQTNLVRKLFEIKGVRSVTLFSYTIRIHKAEVFGWDELRPEIEEVVLRELTAK